MNAFLTAARSMKPVARNSWLIVLVALLARPALAEPPGCGARTAQEMRTVFAVATGLNDAARRAAAEIATPEYLELRAKLSEYDTRQTLPCAAAAAGLLETTPDAALARALLDLVPNHDVLQPATLPRSLARFFEARPQDFSGALATMRADDRCVVVETLESGAIVRERSDDANLAHARAVANLKRIYCHPAASKPARESPGNRARERMNPDRAPRPRLA